MGTEFIGYFMLVIIIVSILMGIPVAFSLASIPLIFGLSVMGPKIFSFFEVRAFGMLTNYAFVAAPLFIFMGALLEKSNIAEGLYRAFYQLLGPTKGGLALATVALATVFGACTGIVGAGVITIGLLALRPMLSRGYDKRLATGSIMVGGGLGVIIPPSLMLILYGCVGGVSIAALFVGAIIPGIILGGLYMLYVFILANLKPEIGPPIREEERIHGRKLFLLVLKALVPPVALIFAVLGTIFFGVVAPSEAGAMGCLGAFLLALASRTFNLRVLKDAITSTVRITTSILLICLGGQFFTTVFMYVGADRAMRAFLLGLKLGPVGTMLIMLFIIFLLGMIMDWIALIFILVPIFTPLISSMGIDPLYFGVIFCLTLQISNMTPPFAYSAFYLKTICPPEITMGDLYRGCIPFALVSTLAPLITLLFPWLILYLPSLMK